MIKTNDKLHVYNNNYYPIASVNARNIHLPHVQMPREVDQSDN